LAGLTKVNRKEDFWTYSVTRFLGKSLGMYLRLRLEQSTTAPEAEQEQGAGHLSWAAARDHKSVAKRANVSLKPPPII